MDEDVAVRVRSMPPVKKDDTMWIIIGALAGPFTIGLIILFVWIGTNIAQTTVAPPVATPSAAPSPSVVGLVALIAFLRATLWG